MSDIGGRRANQKMKDDPVTRWRFRRGRGGKDEKGELESFALKAKRTQTNYEVTFLINNLSRDANYYKMAFITVY